MRQPTLNKLLILDWYDGVLDALANDSNGCWHRYWRVTWNPGDQSQLFAAHSVQGEWVEQFIKDISSTPEWPNWMPQLPDESAAQLQAMTEAVLAQSPDLTIASFSSGPLGAADSSCRVSSVKLAKWARPSTVEELSEQTEKERIHIETLLGNP